MNSCFQSADLMLPAGGGFDKWAVIACDQFTSDKAYWERVEKFVGDAPSTLNLVLPEIYLETNAAERIGKISENMAAYQSNGTFKTYASAFVYVERTLLDGSIRPGIVGMIDLEQYHYDPSKKPAIGATEQTVLERIPPRIAVRREAAIEFPHVILFCNDAQDQGAGQEQRKELFHGCPPPSMVDGETSKSIHIIAYCRGFAITSLVYKRLAGKGFWRYAVRVMTGCKILPLSIVSILYPADEREEKA